MRLREVVAGCAFVALCSFSGSAAPCATFAAARAKTVPSLAVEQTLIIHDRARELEHFIRQIAIRDPSPGFGFVVPVPSQPTVAKVQDEPFARLATAYRVAPPGLVAAGASGGGPPKRGASGVQVLSRQTVGSFTAFVLSASDPFALKRWFDDNQLGVAPEAQSWLDHYVKQGFFFVALRYEKSARDSAKAVTRAETLRISFSTPLPFYPYREPEPERSAAAPRDLALWLVASAPSTPISLQETASEQQWRRPLLEHLAVIEPRAPLVSVLGRELEPLLPSGEELSVQVFEDQKRSRAGYGDIVMVPRSATALTSAELAHSRKLMAALDPAVAP